MDRQAPKLIKEIKRRFEVTQPELAPVLGITQQAVSEYQCGNVTKERYDVIKKLEAILAGKIIVPKITKESARKLKRMTLAREGINEGIREKIGRTKPNGKASGKR